MLVNTSVHASVLRFLSWLRSCALAQHSATRTNNLSTHARPAPAQSTTRSSPPSRSTRTRLEPEPGPQMRVPATRAGHFETISRSRQNGRNTLRVSLSTIISKKDNHVTEKQAQGFYWSNVMEKCIKFTCNENLLFASVYFLPHHEGRSVKITPKSWKTEYRPLI